MNAAEIVNGRNCDFDVFREAMKAEEPALALDSIEGRIPFDCFAHARNGAFDNGVGATPDVAFPVRHGRDTPRS